jgi:tyrosinase
LAVSPQEVTKQAKGHCMFRDVADGKDDPNAVAMAPAYNKTNVERIQKEEYYSTFAQMLEGGPHGVIHASLGGEMNPTTSPNEPLFFLHHPQIDRIWWQWQQKNITERRDQYFGDKLDEYGFTEGPASLTDVLKMNGLAPDITVKDIMDTSDPRWCYKY